MSKKCLVTTLRDYVDDNSAFENLNDFIFYSETIGDNTAFLRLSAEYNNILEIKPMYGYTFADGTTEPLDIKNNGYEIYLNDKSYYKICSKNNNRSDLLQLNMISCYANTIIFSDLSIDILKDNTNIDNISFYKDISTQQIPITIFSNKKIYSFKIRENTNIYGSLDDIRFSSQVYNIDITNSINISCNIENLSKYYKVDNINYYLSIYINYTNSYGSIEQLVNNIRSHGYTTSDDVYHLYVYCRNSQVTWKSELITTEQTQSQALITWTETTITYNGETIEA